MNCKDCGAAISWAETNCLACGAFLGFPNVREVSAPKEHAALEQGFQQALAEATSKGYGAIAEEFAEKVAQESVAVINLWPDFLHQLLCDEKTLYSSYALQTAAETRTAAAMLNDKQRRGTEGTLFGDYALQIRYAALSLNGQGLFSYGSCSVTLQTKLCENKATLLAENSYDFVHKHRLLPGYPCPLGYRAVWQERHWLATRKIVAKLNKHSKVADFPRYLLYCDGKRENDDFIEIHLYGAFNRLAFTAAQLPDPVKIKDQREKLTIKACGDYLTQYKTKWNIY